MRRRATQLLLLAIALSAGAARAQAEASEGAMPPAMVLYLERCGGCHGIQGVSAPDIVPTLRGQAGYFLCTREGREYIARLPSVASTPADDDLLAALVNFVAFDIGGGDDARYPHFTAEEVARLRRAPLTHATLTAYRRAVVERLIKTCGAPESLRTYVGPPSS
jgi:hypothetical protein